jgi:cardiolipin synthase
LCGASASAREGSDTAPAQAEIVVLKDGDYYPAVLSLVRSARKRIECALYLVHIDEEAHPEGKEIVLLDALVEAAGRGVTVRMILDVTRQRRNREPEERESVEGKNHAAARYLLKRGIRVEQDSLDRVMHDKLLIVDGETVVVGSSNWTYSALFRNSESSLLVRSKEVARRFRKHLQEMETAPYGKGLEGW